VPALQRSLPLFRGALHSPTDRRFGRKSWAFDQLSDPLITEARSYQTASVCRR
jgi:hypothetical protein